MVNEIKTAKFNEAINYLNRINQAFSMCNMSAASLDPYSWFSSLRILDRELNNYMEDDVRASVISLVKEIALQIDSFQRKNSYGNGVPVPLYENLDKLEKLLRQVYNKAGLQMAYKEDNFVDFSN